MSFDTLERSAASSVPIELYEFTYLSQTQYYTSSEDNITDGVNVCVIGSKRKCPAVPRESGAPEVCAGRCSQSPDYSRR